MVVSTREVRFSPYRLVPPALRVKWVAPAPLWGGASGIGSAPWLAEFQDDSFVQDFISLMGGQTPGDLQRYDPTDSNPDGSWKLYQPLHQRYYLVTGSLVCRQYSLPDHSVARKFGEKTSFVLRRLINDPVYGWIECGWMKNAAGSGSWQQVTDKFGNYNQLTVSSVEERQPLHPVKANVSAIPLASTQAAVGQSGPEQRTVYYGYIPVASREKYLSPAQPADIQQVIQDSGGSAQLELEDVQSRVLDQWQRLFDPKVQTILSNAPEQAAIVSVYLLIDLGDFLKTNLPNVFNAIKNSQQLSKNPAQQALLDELNKIFVNISTDGEQSVVYALHKLIGEGYLDDGNDAALGQSDPPYGQGDPPTEAYDLTKAQLHYAFNDPLLTNGWFVGTDGRTVAPTTPRLTSGEYPFSINAQYVPQGGTGVNYLAAGGILAGLFGVALTEGGTPVQIPPEVANMIKVEPTSADVYFVRLAYERNGCPPVVSEPSASFTFAKFFDPDAPARHIRVELPSIKLQDLRKFKKGVGMQSSCELNALMGNLSLGGLTGDGGISLPGACDIGMICSFSIQIITLVAVIVMFTFLIALNIVFWWLPFIKICFPVPRPK
jgi:hypothetical protein